MTQIKQCVSSKYDLTILVWFKKLFTSNSSVFADIIHKPIKDVFFHFLLLVWIINRLNNLKSVILLKGIWDLSLFFVLE